MDKAYATAAANRLACRLGDGYEPVVHENLGWHYCVRKGAITVYEYIVQNPMYDGFPASYRASIEPGKVVAFNEDTMGISVQIFAKGKTPEEAVEKVLKSRDENCNKLIDVVAALKAVKG